MFINKDELRRLANKKASRPMIGQGIPAPNEGIDGDFRLNSTPSGVKLYAKYAGQWFGFSPDTAVDIEQFSRDVDDSLSDEGSIVFPGGFMMAWGKHVTDETTETITFPTKFPTKCAAVYLTGQVAADDTGSTSDHVVTSTPTATGFTISSYTSLDAVYWLAIGN